MEQFDSLQFFTRRITSKCHFLVDSTGIDVRQGRRTVILRRSHEASCRISWTSTQNYHHVRFQEKARSVRPSPTGSTSDHDWLRAVGSPGDDVLWNGLDHHPDRTSATSDDASGSSRQLRSRGRTADYRFDDAQSRAGTADQMAADRALASGRAISVSDRWGLRPRLRFWAGTVRAAVFPSRS